MNGKKQTVIVGGSQLFISELAIWYDARIHAEIWNLQVQDP
jgi:hypothetical protein